jgi:polyribonucleotide nucleotidyltransferase
VRKLAGGKRVENVEDVLSVGQKILVQITKVDDRGKLSLQPVVAEEADTDGSGASSENPTEPAEGSTQSVEA